MPSDGKRPEGPARQEDSETAASGTVLVWASRAFQVRFVAVFVDMVHRYVLGIEEESATAYLSIPVGSNLTDYEEFYAVSAEEYLALRSDPGAARMLAEQCRRREHDDRLILKPGWNRGEPW
jgi:hypothetical protein